MSEKSVPMKLLELWEKGSPEWREMFRTEYPTLAPKLEKLSNTRQRIILEHQQKQSNLSQEQKSQYQKQATQEQPPKIVKVTGGGTIIQYDNGTVRRMSPPPIVRTREFLNEGITKEELLQDQEERDEYIQKAAALQAKYPESVEEAQDDFKVMSIQPPLSSRVAAVKLMMEEITQEEYEILVEAWEEWEAGQAEE